MQKRAAKRVLGCINIPRNIDSYIFVGKYDVLNIFILIRQKRRLSAVALRDKWTVCLDQSRSKLAIPTPHLSLTSKGR